MKYFFKAIPLFVFVAFSFTCFSQTKYCPRKNVLIQYYQSKKFQEALDYIDTVLVKCPDQKSDPHFLNVCATINYVVYNNLEKDPNSSARERARDYAIQCINNDIENLYKEKMLSLLNTLAISYINDAYMIFQKMSVNKINNASNYFDNFKILKSIVDNNYDFSEPSFQYFQGTALLYKVLYESDKAKSSMLDSTILYFNKALSINPNDYVINKELGILYHNLGVDIILEELDIDADLEMVILMQEQAVNYFTQSLPYLSKVYEMQPNNKDVISGLAAVYYSLNDMELHVKYMDLLEGLESESSGGK